MVMDATPSPQSVGREFVRQYYTLLNKAPNHLHRFYNNHSSFVHGGLDQHNRDAAIVVGQKNIHNKIQQLNFRDCHAKISQVDSQATLGSGVVVQVTGELSNDGQPMRRFTQTFVLAAQSPKKYYVHNDIFRYQDFYSDDEVEVESGGRSENDEEIQESESIETTSNMSQPPQIYYSLPVPTQQTGQTVPIQTFAQAPQINGVAHDDILQGMPAQPGAMSLPIAATTAVQSPQPQTESTVIAMEPVVVASSPTIPSPVTNTTPLAEETVESPIPPKVNDVATEVNIEKEQEPVKPIEKIEIKDEPIKPAETKTYAYLVKSNVSGLSFASAITSSPPSIVSGNSTRQNTLSPPPHKYQQEDSRRSDSNTGPLPQRNNNRTLNRERRSSNTNNQSFGDSHQLFVGNVPHHATEDELRTLFSKFGTVAELRILSKSGQKVSGGRAPPNYGFITYDDPESVQNCLSNTPLYYPDNSPDGQKLNIEEKKTKSWSSNEPGSGNTTNNMRGNSGTPSRSGGGSGGAGTSTGSSVRGGSNQGLSRGGSGGRGGGGGGGGGAGRNNFNRTDRGGSSVTRTVGNSGSQNSNFRR